MQKPQIGEYNPYFQRYIDLVSEGNIADLLAKNTAQVKRFFKKIPVDKHDFRYAEGKWTIKEVLIHIIDTERVMAYRAMAISRGDMTSLPGFDENTYVENVDVSSRTMESLLAEFMAVRAASQVLIANMTEAQSKILGNANSHGTTPRALVFILLGHPIYHINVTKERYLKK
jgi:uncharacterized damage-inducible protein DinB